MKIIQRLEVGAGVATLIAALLSFFLISIPLSRKIPQNDNGWFWSFFFLIFPACLTAIGAYFHAFKRSNLALGAVLFLGSVMVFLHALAFLIGTSFNGYLFIGVSPGILAVITMFFALCTVILSSAQNEGSR
jgi:hypothetical protein